MQVPRAGLGFQITDFRLQKPNSAEELGRWGRTEEDLEKRAKSDPEKLALAARLRRKTPLSLRRLAQRLRMGISKSAPTPVYHWRQPTVNASEETEVLML